MKTSTVVQKAVTDLNRLVKEVKQSDQEDLGQLSEAFDEIALRADAAAALLGQADKALSGEQEGEAVPEPEPDNGEDPNDGTEGSEPQEGEE